MHISLHEKKNTQTRTRLQRCPCSAEAEHWSRKPGVVGSIANGNHFENLNFTNLSFEISVTIFFKTVKNFHKKEKYSMVDI